MDEAIIEFTAEAREGIEALDAKLVAFEQAPDDPELLGDIFRLIHSIKGTSGFLGLLRLQTVAHAAENVLGAFRDGELAVEPDSVGAVLEAVDVVREIIDVLGAGLPEPVGDDTALIARLDGIFAGATPVGSPEPETPSVDASVALIPSPKLLQLLGGEATLDVACEIALCGAAADPALSAHVAAVDPDALQAGLREALVRAAASPQAPAFAAAVAGLVPNLPVEGLEALRQRLAEGLGSLEIGAEAIEAILPAPTSASGASDGPVAGIEQEPAPQVEAPEPPAAAAGTRSEAETGPQTIRVGVDVLENLMTTASELVLIRNQLIQTLRDQPDSPFAGPLHRLNQVTSELQEGVMTTRMQPISGAWAKLPRLVRDLAVDLGKKIDLVLTGQDTELDRQVMELIKDPLTHMIRNAADHGLEAPAEWRRAGKPETGRIHLSARHEGGAILIEMSDDGRGLDVARIKAKAVQNGLITAAQAAAMGDAEARHLIFAPGFSTAEQVTTVSGRGVGMDVVRTNIEKIGGAIELASATGQGTRFTIRIPLTLSIVSALIVECAGERFALPQAGIVELVSAGSAEGARRLESLNGATVLRLRDKLLPVIALKSTLRLETTDALRPEACIVVAKAGGFTFGVLVDRVFDTEEIVVKPVASILRHLRLYSGATILGDGAVVMILDFKGIAVESGAGHLLNAGEDVAETVETPREPTESLLVFRASDGSLKAAPLNRVARIEELSPGRLESVDGRSVLQYRDRLMPVLETSGGPASADIERCRPLLVFARGELNLGLLVDEIVDIAEAVMSSDLDAATPGVVGSIIIDGQAAGLIDIDFYWRRASGHPEPERASPGPAAGRRLLVVDGSPFTQLLVRPLLSQAGYAVDVAPSPEAALAMHDAGERYDLILADTTPRGAETRRLVMALSQAEAWRETPLLGLGVQSFAGGATGEFAEAQLLNDVDETLNARAA